MFRLWFGFTLFTSLLCVCLFAYFVCGFALTLFLLVFGLPGCVVLFCDLGFSVFVTAWFVCWFVCFCGDCLALLF